MVACLGESTGSPAKTDFISTATAAIRARVFVLCASNHDACLYKFAFLKRPALGTPDDKKYFFFKFEGRPADTRKRELIQACVLGVWTCMRRLNMECVARAHDKVILEIQCLIKCFRMEGKKRG